MTPSLISTSSSRSRRSVFTCSICWDLLERGHEVSDASGVEVDIGTPDMLKPAIRDQVLAEAHPL